MAPRLELQAILAAMAPNPFKAHFQPPPNLRMSYPCIVYQRDNAETEFAGNRPYSYTQRYSVTLIDPDPDSSILAKIAALPMCIFNRHYVVDGLNHDVFVLYY